jgi:hypothetical protein
MPPLSGKLSNYALDTFVAPKLSELTECNITDISDQLEQANNWITHFVLNSIFKVVGYNPEAKASVLFFLRRAEAAFREFHYARIFLLEYLSQERENVSVYFEVLFHLETCIAQMWQAVAQLISQKKKITGQKEQIYKKGEGSSYERLNLLYNMSRYAGDNVLEEATMPIWITNIGIEGKEASISYTELVDILNEIGDFADKLTNPKKHNIA